MFSIDASISGTLLDFWRGGYYTRTIGDINSRLIGIVLWANRTHSEPYTYQFSAWRDGDSIKINAERSFNWRGYGYGIRCARISAPIPLRPPPTGHMLAYISSRKSETRRLLSWANEAKRVCQ